MPLAVGSTSKWSITHCGVHVNTGVVPELTEMATLPLHGVLIVAAGSLLSSQALVVMKTAIAAAVSRGCISTSLCR
jgi:hypothetical protein